MRRSMNVRGTPYLCCLGLIACQSSSAARSGGAGTAGAHLTVGTGNGGATNATSASGATGSSSAGRGVPGQSAAGRTAGQAGTAAALAADGGGGGEAGSANSRPAACQASMDRVRISEIDLGMTVQNNEVEVNLKPLVIAPLPSGGSRLAFMGGDGMVHVAALDPGDQPSGDSVSLAGYDFDALYADAAGGTVMLTRAAHGSGDKQCGTLTNLCGSTASLPSSAACFDMYLVRFDGTSETWATQLSQSSEAEPPYLTSPTDPMRVVYIWQTYAHHGRLAFDGTDYAAYYGAAISVTQTCVNADSALANAVNIHQGDELRVVGPSGALLTGHNSFDWGCSHSGFERVLWDPGTNKFVPVCKTDNDNRIALAPNYTTIFPLDLAYADLGNLVLAANGGYWLTTSNIRAGQPAGARGLAEVLLLHFSTGMADKSLSLSADAPGNQRAPHLSAYGTSRLMAAWESSSAPGDLSRTDKNRKFSLQVLDANSGAPEGPALELPFLGNRYQDLVAFPDGSVAFVAPGSSASKVKILRVLPCDS
jgi:hypothetical protein